MVNVLAHLYLADSTPASMLGNLLPDLHRGGLKPADVGPEVWEGVRRHRRVDAFTDTHPVFGRSRARLRGDFGHFAGVLVDVIYDHCLSVRWAELHPQPRAAFIAAAYAGLRSQTVGLAPRTRRVVGLLCDEDWVTPYATVGGIRHTLKRMSARVFERSGRRVELEKAADVLNNQAECFLDDFSEFFPELVAYIGVEPKKA